MPTHVSKKPTRKLWNDENAALNRISFVDARHARGAFKRKGQELLRNVYTNLSFSNSH